MNAARGGTGGGLDSRVSVSIEVQLPAVTNAEVWELHLSTGEQEPNHVQIAIEP